MKKETITVHVDYEIEYEPDHRQHAIEKAMRLSSCGSGGASSKATQLTDTVRLVEGRIGEPRHCEFFDRDQEMNKRIIEASGSISDSDHLVSFLYELMRDAVPPGRIERIVWTSLHRGTTEFCNGFLAQYAQDVAKRLKG